MRIGGGGMGCVEAIVELGSGVTTASGCSGREGGKVGAWGVTVRYAFY